MLVVTVELVEKGQRDKIARIEIERDNTGIEEFSNFDVRQTQPVSNHNVQKARVLNFPLNKVHILHLVARAFERLNYGAW